MSFRTQTGQRSLCNRRPLLPSIGNDPGAPDAEVEPLDAVAAAHGDIQTRVPPAEVCNVRSAHGITCEQFAAVYV